MSLQLGDSNAWFRILLNLLECCACPLKSMILNKNEFKSAVQTWNQPTNLEEDAWPNNVAAKLAPSSVSCHVTPTDENVWKILCFFFLNLANRVGQSTGETKPVNGTVWFVWTAFQQTSQSRLPCQQLWGIKKLLRFWYTENPPLRCRQILSYL